MTVRELKALLRDMDPVLDPEAWAFVPFTPDDPLATDAFASVREAEGEGGVVPLATVRATGREPWFVAARITLRVPSDLAAVGLTAAVATSLADRGIACNVIAGLRHDHLFVPWERRDEALAALHRLATRD